MKPCPRIECLEALSAYRDLSTRELAHLEQISTRTLEDWAEHGVGPPYRKAGHKTARRRYPLSGYLEWRERGTGGGHRFRRSRCGCID